MNSTERLLAKHDLHNLRARALIRQGLLVEAIREIREAVAALELAVASLGNQAHLNNCAARELPGAPIARA